MELEEMTRNFIKRCTYNLAMIMFFACGLTSCKKKSAEPFIIKLPHESVDNFDSNALRGTAWLLETRNPYKTTVETFTDSTMISKAFYKKSNDSIVHRYLYYLSETKNKAFDFSKTGCPTSGIYLVLYNQATKEVINQQIAFIGISKMTLLHPIYGDSIVYIRQ